MSLLFIVIYNYLYTRDLVFKTGYCGLTNETFLVNVNKSCVKNNS